MLMNLKEELSIALMCLFKAVFNALKVRLFKDFGFEFQLGRLIAAF